MGEPKPGGKEGDNAAEPKPDTPMSKSDTKTPGDPKMGDPKGGGEPKPGDPKAGGDRPMGTWVVVSADVLADDPELVEWVARGLRAIR